MVDLSLVYVAPTFLVPQMVGGLILGFGFVIGGYCPGTSLVGIATGRLDAVVYALGIFAGIFAFGEAVPVARPASSSSTPMGSITLPELFHLPFGLVVSRRGADGGGRLRRRRQDRAALRRPRPRRDDAWAPCAIASWSLEQKLAAARPLLLGAAGGGSATPTAPAAG